jgi:hypothetical protein
MSDMAFALCLVMRGIAPAHPSSSEHTVMDRRAFARR